MFNERIHRLVAAAAASALVVSGVIVGTGTAQAKPDATQSSISASKAGPSAQLSDRWLNRNVDRTVTQEAKTDFRAANEAGRDAYRAAMEAAGDDADAKAAAKGERRVALADAVAAYDAATLPAAQVAPVTQYRQAVAGAVEAKAVDQKAARSQFASTRTELRETYAEAKEAATTDDEISAAKSAYRSGVKEAKAALRVASKAATQDFRTDIKTARDALIAALNSTA